MKKLILLGVFYPFRGVLFTLRISIDLDFLQNIVFRICSSFLGLVFIWPISIAPFLISILFFIHESGHIFFALFTGASSVEVKLFSTIPSGLPDNVVSQVLFYSGGMIFETAVLGGLILYFSKWGWKLEREFTHEQLVRQFKAFLLVILVFDLATNLLPVASTAEGIRTDGYHVLYALGINISLDPLVWNLILFALLTLAVIVYFMLIATGLFLVISFISAKIKRIIHSTMETG
ncbi:MAG: hypothetical protein ACFFD4_13670 [Candidatus Odinarchaeota archaeon]